ncbi:hypothetical protein BKA65DRAFT_507478 [Rhexocercosporidium sp. MPI-PUGE-AT-0058]|nr:hypothetical protein BKA65DRAFT_507478 [Rhexocercosporidium sp. MPI-PUGE-AT-0058]
MSDSSLPVILFGKLPALTTPQIEALLPEIKVTHLITSLTSARTELPALISPSSNRAAETTHSFSQQRRPVIIIVGGGFTDEEFEELRGLGEKELQRAKRWTGKKWCG